MALQQHPTAQGPNDVQRRVLSELFERHFDELFAFCVVRSGSRQLAEEVASDTFVDAARHLLRSDGAELSAGWLFTVARRRLIDHWRAAQRQQDRLARLRRERFDGTPDDGFDGDRVVAAIQSLPERQRAALVLRYLDELSVAETAEALDISYQATESLVARAKRSFIAAYDRTPA